MNKFNHVVLLGVLVMGMAMSEEPATPASDEGKLGLKFSGYSQYLWSETTTEVLVEDDLEEVTTRYSELERVRLFLKLDGEKGGLFAEVSPIAAGEGDENWLKRLYVYRNLGEHWQLKAGRFLKAGGWALPAPQMLETVSYPHAVPFGNLAWGMQLEGKYDDWSVLADLTGRSDTFFNSSEAFDRLEASVRISRLYEKGSVAGTIEVSEDFLRYGFDGEWKPREEWLIRGGVFSSRNSAKEESNFFGAYVLTAYRPVQWLELHTQLDHRQDIPKTYHQWEILEGEDGNKSVERVKHQSSDEERTAWTTGFRLMSAKERFTLTVDYETVLDGPREDKVLIRGQVKF
jgi:hypothetical protein